MQCNSKCPDLRGRSAGASRAARSVPSSGVCRECHYLLGDQYTSLARLKQWSLLRSHAHNDFAELVSESSQRARVWIAKSSKGHASHERKTRGESKTRLSFTRILCLCHVPRQRVLPPETGYAPPGSGISFSRRKRGVIVRPCAKTEKATTPKATVMISSRWAMAGSPSANARASAPRKPPQNKTC